MEKELIQLLEEALKKGEIIFNLYSDKPKISIVDNQIFFKSDERSFYFSNLNSYEKDLFVSFVKEDLSGFKCFDYTIKRKEVCWFNYKYSVYARNSEEAEKIMKTEFEEMELPEEIFTESLSDFENTTSIKDYVNSREDFASKETYKQLIRDEDETTLMEEEF